MLDLCKVYNLNKRFQHCLGGNLALEGRMFRVICGSGEVHQIKLIVFAVAL